MDHQLAQLNENIRETNMVNNNLDGDLKLGFRNKYEFDQKSKDDKNELEHKIRETKYNLERAETENYSLKQKLEDTESKYSQVYRENERILLDFEENKQASYNSNNNKDAEIQRLKAEF